MKRALVWLDAIDAIELMRWLAVGGTLLLPLTVPWSGAVGNLELRSYLLWVAGAIALATLLLDHEWWRRVWRSGQRWALWLLGVYGTAFILATALSRQPGLALFGAFGFRPGLLSELAAVLIGLVALPLLNRANFWRFFFVSSVAITVVSLVISWSATRIGERLGGVFYQPNTLAAWLSVAILVGLLLWRRRWANGWLWLGQAILLFSLVLTNSRLSLALLGLVVIAWVVANRRQLRADKRLGWRTLIVGGGITLAILMGLGALNFRDHRLTDGAYLAESISYRWQLQLAGVRLLPSLSWHGVGPNGLPAVFIQQRLPVDLQASENEGYQIASTHNVLLDRWLELGPFGLTYVVMLVVALIVAWRNRHDGIIPWLLLFFTGYILLNDLSIELNTIVWLVMFGAIFGQTFDNSA